MFKVELNSQECTGAGLSKELVLFIINVDRCDVQQVMEEVVMSHWTEDQA